MQVTTLSFFRFRGLFARCWAFVSMQLAKKPLRDLEGIGFHKLMGTGSGQGFDLAPDFSAYVILATWPSLDEARTQVEGSKIYSLYRRRAVEAWTVYLRPIRARGSWDRQKPFETASEAAAAEANSLSSHPEWVGVLTRASVRFGCLIPFWRSVPPISQVTAGHPGLHFKLGMGEQPIIQLMTFSIWQELEPVQSFAYRPGPHRDAMKLARAHKWFREELFARFRILESSGSWNGVDPVAPSPAREKELVG